MSDCTCVVKTYAAARVGDPLKQRHRHGCPRAEVVDGFCALSGDFAAEITAAFDWLEQRKREWLLACAVPRWVLYGEPEPLALVKVGCTALVRTT